MANNKSVSKTSTKSKPSFDLDPNLEEEMAAMLKSEYGEDTEVLELIEELEKTPDREAGTEHKSKEGDSSEIRHCPNCRFDALFINCCCSECGHTLNGKKPDDDDDTEEDDDTGFSGYNTDNDE